MNRRTLLIFILIFVGLAIVTVVIQNPPANPSTPPLPAQEQLSAVYERLVFPDIALVDIQAVRLQNPSGEINFTINRTTDGSWTAPDLAGTLDIDSANNIARTIVLLPALRTLPITDDTDLRQYGFDPVGFMFINVLMVDGSAHSVAVGAINLAETAYYALVDERDELYVIERAAVDFLITQLRSPPVN
jgi:hypothetical protein